MRSPGVKWPESPRGCAPSTGRRGAGHRLPGHRAAVSRNTCSRHLRRGFHCRSWCSHCPFPFHKAASVNTAVCVQHPRLRLRQPPGLHLVVRGPAGSRGLFLALPLPAPPKASACPCESAPHSRCPLRQRLAPHLALPLPLRQRLAPFLALRPPLGQRLMPPFRRVQRPSTARRHPPRSR